jgi:hypothetical protein
MILIITYDLKNPGHNYVPLFEAIKSQGAWCHYLTATWLLATDNTPEQVYNAICSKIMKSDRLLVATLSNGYEGWLPKDAWDWLRARGLNSR